MTELVLPSTLEDLLESSSGFQICESSSINEFASSEVYDMIEKISDISSCNFTEISQQCIDSIYAMLIGFNDISDDNKKAFVNAFIDVVTYGLRIASENEELSSDCKDNIRIVLFFFQHLCLRVETHCMSQVVLDGDKKKASKKSKRSVKSDFDDEETSSFDWTALRPVIIDLNKSIIEMDHTALWKMGIVAESFLTNCWKIPLNMLENACSGTNNSISGTGANEVAMRNKCMSIIVASINTMTIGNAADAYTTLNMSFMDVLCHYESMAGIITKIISQLKPGNPCSSELIREIGSMNMSELNKTSSTSVKHIGLLIVNLAEAIPGQMSLFMPMMMQQLNSDVYQIRSALLQAMGSTCGYICEIIIAANAKNQVVSHEIEEPSEDMKDDSDDEEEDIEDMNVPKAAKIQDDTINSLEAAMDKMNIDADEETIDTLDSKKAEKYTNIEGMIRVRDRMLDLLIERTHDMSPFTRAVVLKVWVSLVESNSIPVKRFASVAEIGFDRLMDKTGIVRKSAIALLSALIENNPFAGELNLDVFKSRQTELEKLIFSRLSELMKDVLKTPAEGMKKKKEVLTTISEEDEEEDSDCESDVEHASGDCDAEEALLLKTQQHMMEQDEALQFMESDDQLKQYNMELNSYIKQAIEFIQIIQSSIPIIRAMLLSKTQGDVIQSLRFIANAVKFNTCSDLSNKCLRASFSLIFHPDESIRNECLSTFIGVYLPNNIEDGSVMSPMEIATNLVTICNQCDQNMSEMTSLENIISDLYLKSILENNAITCIWELTVLQDDANAVQITIAGYAYTVLSMIAKCSPAILTSERIKHVIQSGLVSKSMILMRGALLCLQAAPAYIIAPPGVNQINSKANPLPNYDNPTEIQIHYTTAYATLQDIIIGALFDQMTDSPNMETATWSWFSLCELTIHVLFHIHPQPDIAIGRMISHMYEEIVTHCNLHNGVSTNTTVTCILSRFLFVLGQTALCTLVFTERFATITKRYNELNEATKKKNASKANAPTDDELEMEMGMSAARDAEHEKRFLQSTEYDMCLNEKNLLAKFHPFIAFIAANENNLYNHVMLKHTSTLALCRYMSVSSMLSEQYLPLLFTILEKEADPLAFAHKNDSTVSTGVTPSTHSAQLRTTIMICLGDLAFRFPNALEPWTHRMYNRLSDSNPTVRYNSLMVLTHLVLNDMIKVKGQVVHVVMCIADKSDVIRDLSRLLFTELSKRSNNPIYNLMGDIIGKLSATAGLSEDRNDSSLEDTDAAPESGSTSDDMVNNIEAEIVVASLKDDESEQPLRVLNIEEFKSIMSFLLKFIQKDKQADGLCERLIVRMGSSTSIRQSRLLAYCISQLPVTEKGIKKMVELFRYIKDALYDPEVHDLFQSSLKNAKKNHSSSMRAATATSNTTPSGDESKETTSTVATMKSSTDEFQTLLDSVRVAASGVVAEDSNATESQENSGDDANADAELYEVKREPVVVEKETKKRSVKKSATLIEEENPSTSRRSARSTTRKTSK